MSDKMIKTDYLIIFFSFVLCVFHTFTFFQAYYSFIVTLATFLVILLLHLYKSGWRIKISSKIGRRLLFLYTGIFLVVFIGVALKGNPIISALGAYLPLAMWPTLYVIVAPILKGKLKKRYVLAFFCFFAVSVIATLSVVIVDNGAARELAGAASDEVRNEYYKAGVGGYGFVYGSVFLVYTLLLYGHRQHNRTMKVLLLLLTILTCVMIVFASYTTALLLMLIVLLLSLYARTNSRKATVIFAFLIAAIVLLINPILNGIYEIAQNMDLYWISKRIGQLINAETSGNVEGLTRVQLYMRSMNSFLENPIFGAGEVGGHSMFFDTLGNYGLFGLILLVSICTWLGVMMKETKKREGLAYILVIALLVVNTIDQIVFIPLMLFVVPLIMQHKETNDENRNHNALLQK
ncbi:MAG: O-antigen ligase family protein [Clostridia bacterium]|nr:O-antigen ligase family protein [Clostridia bacterium]